MLLVQQLAELPSLLWTFGLAPLAVLAWYRPRAGLPLLFLLAGVVWASVRAGAILDESLPAALEGVDLRVEGRIADLPAPAERGLRFRFDIERAFQDGRPVALPRRVQLGFYGEPPVLRVGERWGFVVRLRRPHSVQNPGSFDFEAYLLQQRVRATGTVRHQQPYRLLASLPASLAECVCAGYRLNRFRQQLSARLHAFIPDHPFAGMVTAFANGDDDAIADGQWQVLNRTGTSHLIAISGMNIGLVAGLMYFLLRGLWALPARTVLWLPAPRVAAFGALLAAAGYAALAGFSIPTQRALVMLAVALGGLLLGRRTAPSVLLALALFAVLVVDPLAVLAPGFWLSFLAVAVILVAVNGSRGLGWRERVWAWGKLQWAVALGLLPLLLLFFQQASLSGPLANLVAIPVIELVVIPATLLGVAAGFVLPDGVTAVVLRVAGEALAMLWPLLETLAGLPGTQWTQHAPALWTVAVAAVGILLLLAPRGFPARWLGVVWLLPMFMVRPPAPAAGEVWLTLLDVGQGLSAVVRTATHTLVYDSGARFNARSDAGQRVLVPYLRQAGIARVDTLIISHGDNDHIGGSAALLAALPVDRRLSSVPERVPGAAACAAGQAWEWDGVQFVMLHPSPDRRLTGNNLSCVLRVVSRHGRMLLPGDIAARAERVLLRDQEAQLPADILVAPHHGSKSSSTESFLDAVRPGLALFPVGYRNRYGHPHPDVMQRYRERGIALAASPDAGAISVRLDAAGMHVSRYRTDQRRYWYRE